MSLLAKMQAVSMRQDGKSYCPRGHEYAGDNLQMSSGSATCRACRKERRNGNRT